MQIDIPHIGALYKNTITECVSIMYDTNHELLYSNYVCNNYLSNSIDAFDYNRYIQTLYVNSQIAFQRSYDENGNLTGYVVPFMIENNTGYDTYYTYIDDNYNKRIFYPKIDLCNILCNISIDDESNINYINDNVLKFNNNNSIYSYSANTESILLLSPLLNNEQIIVN